MKQLSQNGKNLLLELEGFRNKPYLDSEGIPTIGIGTTIYPDGSKVKMTDVEITKAQALEYSNFYILQLEAWVNENCKWSPNQNQFDALICFLYNTGIGNRFNSYKNTKYAIINNTPDILSEMKSIRNGGTLDTRRQKECNMFLTGKW